MPLSYFADMDDFAMTFKVYYEFSRNAEFFLAISSVSRII